MGLWWEDAPTSSYFLLPAPTSSFHLLGAFPSFSLSYLKATYYETFKLSEA